MRRAERLFQLTNLLRNRRGAFTAKQLSDSLEVSERTIYRDMQTLSLSGLPIEGEAGVGYRLHRTFDLPPLQFDRGEVESLLLGARMLKAWGDKEMSASATSAVRKILSVMPEGLRELDEDNSIQVVNFENEDDLTAHSDTIRQAIRKKHCLNIQYTRADGEKSERTLWPLGLVFWGKVWTMIAWCTLREDYREFRLDRIWDLEENGASYVTSDTISLNHYLSIVGDDKNGCS
jgi:predicted DNA-binding transcriptional regulator YafY